MKEKIKYLFKRLTGYTIVKQLPFGCQVFEEIERKVNIPISLIFDIGANVGQTALMMKKSNPNAEIWCFEPVEETFRELRKNTNRFDKIKCFQIGFDEERSEKKIFVNKNNRCSRIAEESETLYKAQIKTELISLDILDEFCLNKSIKKVDYLKIDTEGHDLKVLRGASNLLNKKLISFVEVEVGMNPENSYHVPMEEIKSYLESFDYRIFGLYEQVHEWATGKPILRRSNMVFVSKSMFD